MTDRPLVVGDVPTGALVDAFDFLVSAILAFWRAVGDGTLSRHVAPPPEMEDLVIMITSDLWRSIGDALRAGDDTAQVTTTADPVRLRAALDAATRLIAFFPAAREIGVELRDDPTAEATLRDIIAAFVAALDRAET